MHDCTRIKQDSIRISWFNKLYEIHRIEHEEDYSGLNRDYTVVNKNSRIVFGQDGQDFHQNQI